MERKKGLGIKCFSKLLVMTLLIGLLSMVPQTGIQAATNKALRIPVAYNGDRTSATAYTDNSYGCVSGYKGTSKISKNMKVSGSVYVPVAALKKDGDTVHIDGFVDVCNKKSGDFIGNIPSSYTIMLRKEGRKITLAKWNNSKNKEEKIGNIATYKKSGNYYVVSLKKVPLTNKIQTAGQKTISINTKTSYALNQGIVVTGTCSKINGYAYVDNLLLSGTSLRKITFNKKDYSFIDGFKPNGISQKVSVTTIK